MTDVLLTAVEQAELNWYIFSSNMIQKTTYIELLISKGIVKCIDTF